MAGSDNQINFVLSVDSATGQMNIQKFAGQLKQMGIEGVKSSDALTNAFTNMLNRMDGTSKRSYETNRALMLEMIRTYQTTGKVVEELGEQTDNAGKKTSRSMLQ